MLCSLVGYHFGIFPRVTLALYVGPPLHAAVLSLRYGTFAAIQDFQVVFLVYNLNW